MLSNVSLQAKTEQKYVYLFKKVCDLHHKGSLIIKAFRDTCFGFVGHINDSRVFY